MSNQINEAIKCWAAKPTWFSPHPSDKKNLKMAISNLKTLSFTPTQEELETEILNIVLNCSPMLGTPKDIPSEVKKIAKRISSKL